VTLNACLAPNYPNGANVGFDVVVTWSTPTGRFLGRRSIDSSSAGDLGCLTPAPNCQAKASTVWVGFQV
jgi:hypothetical protein